jgi:hypothetical protein
MGTVAANAGVMTAASVLLGIAAGIVSRRLPTRARWAATLAALAAVLAFVVLLRDSALVARIVGADDLPVFGQWTPPITALFLGVAWPLMKGSPARKTGLIVLCATAVIYASYRPLFHRAPRVTDRDIAGCVIQTTSTSCGAAATAILLREHGIAATESEMAAVCLTRSSGTTLHGMIRGLRMKTRGTAWRVEVGRDLTPPCLISVRLTSDVAARDPRYAGQWGWTVGEEHVVVFLGLDDLGARIADPSVGFEHWSRGNVTDLWTGTSIRLASDSPRASAPAGVDYPERP